jgi:hypothetical protein
VGVNNYNNALVTLFPVLTEHAQIRQPQLQMWACAWIWFPRGYLLGFYTYWVAFYPIRKMCQWIQRATFKAWLLIKGVSTPAGRSVAPARADQPL